MVLKQDLHVKCNAVVLDKLFPSTAELSLQRIIIIIKKKKF